MKGNPLFKEKENFLPSIHSFPSYFLVSNGGNKSQDEKSFTIFFLLFCLPLQPNLSEIFSLFPFSFLNHMGSETSDSFTTFRISSIQTHPQSRRDLTKLLK